MKFIRKSNNYYNNLRFIAEFHYNIYNTFISINTMLL